MGTGAFPGVKRPGRGVKNPPRSSAEVKKGVELYLYSPSEAFMAYSRVNFTLLSLWEKRRETFVHCTVCMVIEYTGYSK
jgi:hypothetical protein